MTDWGMIRGRIAALRAAGNSDERIGRMFGVSGDRIEIIMTDSWVYLRQSAMIPTRTRVEGMMNHVTLFAGAKVRKHFADEHGLRYSINPPTSHPDHPHNTPRPS